MLRQRTNLPSPTKETRFFDLHFERGAGWYLAHFPRLRPDRPSGEVSPTYFASEEARKRIAQTVPTAKLIFVFRNPVQRLVSLYRLKRAYGMMPYSLEDALKRDPELIGSGLYATNLRKWQREFPKGRMLVTIYDDLKKDPQGFIDSVTDFLDVPRIQLIRSQLQNVHSAERLRQPRFYIATHSATVLADWCKARNLDYFVAVLRRSPLMKAILGGGSPFEELPQQLAERLEDIFLPEVEQLEAMIGRQLPTWKTSCRESTSA
jgi:hypothetical protein